MNTWMVRCHSSIHCTHISKFTADVHLYHQNQCIYLKMAFGCQIFRLCMKGLIRRRQESGYWSKGMQGKVKGALKGMGRRLRQGRQIAL